MLKAVDFTIPVPPDHLHPNRRPKKLFLLTKAKRSYQNDVGILVREQKRRFEKILPIESALVVSRFALPSGLAQHQHDKDNLISWLKYAIDVLEKEGVVVNDRHLHYKTPEQTVCQRPELRLSLMVFDDEGTAIMKKAMEMARQAGKSASEKAWITTVMDVRSQWGKQ